LRGIALHGAALHCMALRCIVWHGVLYKTLSKNPSIGKPN
jgi:hypothetical protein